MWTIQELEAVKGACEAELDILMPYLQRRIPGVQVENARSILARVVAKSHEEIQAIKKREAEEASKKKETEQK